LLSLKFPSCYFSKWSKTTPTTNTLQKKGADCNDGGGNPSTQNRMPPATIVTQIFLCCLCAVNKSKELLRAFAGDEYVQQQVALQSPCGFNADVVTSCTCFSF
jgi:hypothetical protein